MAGAGAAKEQAEETTTPCVICCGNGGKTHRKMATDPKGSLPCTAPSLPPRGKKKNTNCTTPFGLCGFYNFKIYLRASGSFTRILEEIGEINMTNQWGLQVFHLGRKMLKRIARDVNQIYFQYLKYFQ